MFETIGTILGEVRKLTWNHVMIIYAAIMGILLAYCFFITKEK